jgi:hypothetical protein
MTLADVLLAVTWVGITAYALLGGADFGACFAASSVITPFFLGTVACAVATGRVPVGTARGDPIRSWLNPTSLLGAAVRRPHRPGPSPGDGLGPVRRRLPVPAGPPAAGHSAADRRAGGHRQPGSVLGGIRDPPAVILATGSGRRRDRPGRQGP